MNMKTKRFGIGATLLTLCVAAAGLSWDSVREESSTCVEPASTSEVADVGLEGDQPEAVAVLYPTEGSTVHGVVRFFVVDGGLRVIAEVENLPAGSHGFHIHEFGDCTAPDGASTGGHFNPEAESHGGPLSQARHVGDLGNIEANEQRKGEYDWVDSEISLEGSHSIIGRSVVIRADEDDFTSQPDGDTGARLACGVIGIASGD